MCTRPMPMIKYKCPNEPKWHTKCFTGEYMDEVDIFLTCYVENLKRDGYEADSFVVGCGQCRECRLNYARSWADRCVMEASLYDKSLSWFVTLTYDPMYEDELQNDTQTGLTLKEEHMQKFLKRLRIEWERKYNWKGIRYYYCGEYGDRNKRPHFHILLFNCPFHDLEHLANNKFGDSLYTSDALVDVWNYGFVVVAPLNWNTAAYTARYVMKKQTGKGAALYDKLNIAKPFVRMSLKPGIAQGFYDLHKDSIYDHIGLDDHGNPLFNDKIILPSIKSKANICKPPRLFDKKLENSSPDLYEAIKASRKRYAELQEKQRREAVAMNDRDFFADKERKLDAKKAGEYRKFLDLC